MKIGKLLQSGIVDDHAVIEIFRTYKYPLRSRSFREATGYNDDKEILRFADTDLTEFYYKENPNIITVYI